MPVTEVDPRSKEGIRNLRAKGLDTTKLVEITVCEEDIHFDDMGPGYFVFSYKDSPKNSPQVKLAGYVSSLNDEAFFLVSGWDVARAEPLREKGRSTYHVYGNSVKPENFRAF